VNYFTYLGGKITSDMKNIIDINFRIAQTKNIFSKKRKVFTTNETNMNIRKTQVKSVALSVT